MKRDFPKNLRVFIVPPGDITELNLFAKKGFSITGDIDVADVVVWTGGEDVNPALYGEKPLIWTSFNAGRDVREIKYWRNAPKAAMKIGICRGGQLLNVLNGGRLWQHVTKHSGSHPVTDVRTGRVRAVSSTHHQQFIPANDAEVVAYTFLADEKHNEVVHWRKPYTVAKEGERAFEYSKDYEVLWYPESRSLCFQPHPEYSEPKDTETYFWEIFKRYI